MAATELTARFPATLASPACGLILGFEQIGKSSVQMQVLGVVHVPPAGHAQ